MNIKRGPRKYERKAPRSPVSRKIDKTIAPAKTAVFFPSLHGQFSGSRAFGLRGGLFLFGPATSRGINKMTRAINGLDPLLRRPWSPYARPRTGWLNNSSKVGSFRGSI